MCHKNHTIVLTVHHTIISIDIILQKCDSILQMSTFSMQNTAMVHFNNKDPKKMIKTDKNNDTVLKF